MVSSSTEVSQEAQTAIRSLIPTSAINWVIRPRSRDPGLLYWRQTVVQEVAAQQLLGFAAPVLLSLRGKAVVEYLSLHEGLRGPGAAKTSAARGDVRFRASYLPVGLPWLRASRDSVMHGATLLTCISELTEHNEPGSGHSAGGGVGWPQRFAFGKADRGREGAQLEQDFTVVEVGGVQVGVQVGESDLVCLTWRVRCAGRWCRLSVMTQRDAVAAVELVLGEGLLQAR